MSSIKLRRTRNRKRLDLSSPACLLHEFAPELMLVNNTDIRLKRVYEDPDATDGRRVLVDRLWPRGLSKARARLDDWVRDLAPSSELRKWFAHDPKRWLEFKKRYRVELKGHRRQLDEIRQWAKCGNVTLLYATRDPKINHAVVLKSVLLRRR